MLYSTLRGKKVFSINDAMYIGEITAIYIEKKLLNYGFYVSLNEHKYILSSNHIFAFNDIITITDTNVLMNINDIKDVIMLDIGLSLSDISGMSLGTILDLELRSNKASYLMYDSGKIRITKLVSASDSRAFINLKQCNNEKSFSNQNSQLSQCKKENETKTELLFEEIKMSNSAIPVYRRESSQAVNCDYNFLLGRRVECDITDLTRTLLIKAGTVINASIISAARQAGKLVDLTINSVK
ncbi:MAG: hypothetical protein LBU04_04200 [Christensenellaceae bacterium]|jgi:sporulation protein YlmC with PRC-barrel domain|nr:hypothetical protein [Christensenellaceae bacterium]